MAILNVAQFSSVKFFLLQLPQISSTSSFGISNSKLWLIHSGPFIRPRTLRFSKHMFPLQTAVRVFSNNNTSGIVRKKNINRP